MALIDLHYHHNKTACGYWRLLEMGDDCPLPWAVVGIQQLCCSVSVCLHNRLFTWIIYRLCKDERLSLLRWLTYSGQFTNKVVTCPTISQVQDRESLPLKQQRSNRCAMSAPICPQKFHSFKNETTCIKSKHRLTCIIIGLNAYVYRFLTCPG